MQRRFTLRAVATAGLVLTACSSAGSARVGSTTLPATTTPARTPAQRWAAAHITHYRFDFARTCFCPGGTYRIEVRDGRIIATRRLDEPLPVGDPVLPTIDDLLAETARAQRQATGTVSVSYDPTTGVPRKASIDWLKNAVDDEDAWTITHFTRLP